MRIDELCRQQKEKPSTVNLLLSLSQSQELQDQVNSLNDEKDIYDPQKASSSGFSHVPSQPLRIPNPRGMICRDFSLSHDTRNSMDTLGKVFEDLPVQEGPSSGFENPRNLAPSSCGLRPSNTRNVLKHGEGLRREPQSSAIPTPRFRQHHIEESSGKKDRRRAGGGEIKASMFIKKPERKRTHLVGFGCFIQPGESRIGSEFCIHMRPKIGAGQSSKLNSKVSKVTKR